MGQLSTRTQESARSFVRLIQKYHVGGNGRLGPRAKVFIEETGYLNEIRKTCRDPEDALNRTTNVQETASALIDFENENPKSGLRDYLDDVALASDDDREEKDSQPNGVTLITLHSCKGLEFPHVYLVGVEDGLLPHSRSKEEGTVDEERRLFYVGITRAMQTLTLTHSISRRKFGDSLLCHPSPFLKELPTELIEQREGLKREPATTEMADAFFAQMKQMNGGS